MSDIWRIAPVFPVRDLERSLEFYRSLGFEVRAWRGGGYGFVTRGELELHLNEVDDVQPATAYIFLPHVDAVAAEWLAAGAEVVAPADMEWRQRDGEVVDPDGNLIRFGSPI